MGNTTDNTFLFLKKSSSCSSETESESSNFVPNLSTESAQNHHGLPGLTTSPQGQVCPAKLSILNLSFNHSEWATKTKSE